MTFGKIGVLVNFITQELKFLQICSNHFRFSFSRERKHEKIERKFKTQNPIHSSSSSSSSGKSGSSNSSKKLQTGNGNNVRRSSFTEFCKKNCKLPRRTSGATAAAAASGWDFVCFFSYQSLRLWVLSQADSIITRVSGLAKNWFAKLQILDWRKSKLTKTPILSNCQVLYRGFFV